MVQNPPVPPPPSSRKFLRLLGLLWLSLVGLVVLGNALAPHLGRGTDIVLQSVWHWDWSVFTLEAGQPFFDLSTPASTVKSYYGALYRGDATGMATLTQGPFQAQMRQRVQAGAMAAGPQGTYRSYLTTRLHTDTSAEVLEKFHLFWSQGLRFRLQRAANTWHIVAVEALSEEL